MAEGLGELGVVLHNIERQRKVVHMHGLNQQIWALEGVLNEKKRRYADGGRVFAG